MRERILKGGAALFMRQMVSLPINALGVTLASRFLIPADFGVQAVLTPIIALSVMMIDLGTSQALVQSKVHTSSIVLRQVQFLKSLCGVLVVIILTSWSSWLIRILSLAPSLIWIFPVCGLIGWLQSQRAFQAVALQRRIEWQRLAKVEMVEIVVYNCVLIIAAYFSRTAWCFIIALGFRMGIGAIILKTMNKVWTENGDVANKALVSLLRFGIPLQSTTLLSVLMNSANPIVVGSSLGITAVGFVNWSNYVVSLPQLPLQPLPNFLFSVLSERGRQEKDDQRTIEDISYIGAFLMAVFSLIIILSLDLLVRYVFGLQWIGAIPAASILVLSTVVIVPSQIITAQLNARGYAATSLAILGYGVLLWWAMIIMAALLNGGLIGYAMGVLGSTIIAFLIQCSFASKRLGIRVKWDASIRLIVYVVFCVVAIKMISRSFLEISLIWCDVIKIVIGIAAFAILAFLFEGRRLRQVYAAARSLIS
jgi:O-antigen/teichoic acid export membrane protein